MIKFLEQKKSFQKIEQDLQKHGTHILETMEQEEGQNQIKRLMLGLK